MKFRIVNTESLGYLDKEKYPQIKAEEHDDDKYTIEIYDYYRE